MFFQVLVVKQGLYRKVEPFVFVSLQLALKRRGQGAPAEEMQFSKLPFRSDAREKRNTLER